MTGRSLESLRAGLAIRSASYQTHWLLIASKQGLGRLPPRDDAAPMKNTSPAA